jgi:hypothetical protein
MKSIVSVVTSSCKGIQKTRESGWFGLKRALFERKKGRFSRFDITIQSTLPKFKVLISRCLRAP